MKLYIAEKKEVAKAISDSFDGKLQDGLFVLPNGDKVTWLYGHLLRLADPEEIDIRYQKWQLDDLPMKWSIKLMPNYKHLDHLKFVIEAMKSADELVNAGDPDPEGQRLVDEVIEYSEIDKPVYRILINDNNKAAIQKAAQQIESNDKYQGLSQSALARAVGDMRYGYNLTRAYTLLARKKGLSSVLSVGRVQTPILGLIVRRDNLIENHQASNYCQIKADLSFEQNPVNNRPKMVVSANYVVGDDDLVDEKGRLIDTQKADEIVKAIKNQTARIKQVDSNEIEIAPPLPCNLLFLQSEAAAKFGFSPKKVLEITQTLRDKYKAITYNRSDCRYLNDERHNEAGQLLSALSNQFPFAKTANKDIKSKAFNSSKVTAHHAIIPTLSIPNQLSDDEQKIYQLIVGFYIVQFYPPRILLRTKILFEIAGYLFSATSSKQISAGWYGVIDVDSDDDKNSDQEESQSLDGLVKGDEAVVIKAVNNLKKTQPPKRYTMSSLLKDLASTAKYVTNPKIKSLLIDKDADKADEKGGIGTPATRDGHIETLFNRGFIKEEKKKIISTELGRQLINILPDFATNPDLTALWHEKQKQIENGDLTMQDLLDEIDKSVDEEISRVCKVGLNITTNNPKCPSCDDGYLKKITPKQKDKKPFWGCANYPNCTAIFPDDNNKPNLNYEPPKVSDEYQCPKCSSQLIRRKAKSDKYWWGCSGFPKCDFRAFDENGAPKL